MCVIEAKSLTKLVLRGYVKIDPTFMNHSIKFFSLRVLSLWFVRLGDQHAINHLISFCPLIESITLRSCFAIGSGDGKKEKLKSLSISGLKKLKSVDALGIQDVSIDSPSLENLCYCPSHYNTPFRIDFDRCGNLKELRMWYVKGTFFTAKWFLEQFPKFPFLESLQLKFCKMPERIDISSVRLKVLEIRVDYVDLCNLREFVQNIKPNDVLPSLSLAIGGMSNVDASDPVALQVSSPLPRIKHFDISRVLDNSKHLFSSVVNILLSSCCPTTISLSIYSGSKEFVEFFYKTLMRRKEGECFCSFYDTKCWWHDLNDVKVISPMKMEENVDFKTILELLPSGIISFRLDF